MLGWIKDTLRRSEAAVVVERALQHHHVLGPPPFDIPKVADALVQALWQTRPDILSGKRGAPPHKASVAALALAAGLHEFEQDSEARRLIGVTLSAVLFDMIQNRQSYRFHQGDFAMLELADKASVQFLAEEEARRRPLFS